MPKSKSFKKLAKIISFVLKVAIILVLGIYIFKCLFITKKLIQSDLYIITLLIILILADTFSSISIGNFINLKKEVKELKSTNEKFFNAITNIAVNNVSNNNKIINNLQISGTEQKQRNAIKESELKDETKIINVISNLKNSNKNDDSLEKSNVTKKMSKISFQDIENKCFERYCKENALEISEIDKERKIQFPNYAPFYCDGYYKRGNTDVFIEIKSLEAAITKSDSILNYVNPIEQFNRQGQNKATLHLIVYTFRDDKESQNKISELSRKYRESRFADIVELKPIYLSVK